MENLSLSLDLPPTLLPALSVDDDTLASRLQLLAKREREARADFIVHLAEFDRRRLYLPLGFPSLFAWLTLRLRFSNASAFRRVTACRLHARMPAVGAYLREGRSSLAKLCLLRDVLAPGNCLARLEQAAGMTEKEVEELALILRGKTAPLPRDSIRPLPPPTQEALPLCAKPEEPTPESRVGSAAEVAPDAADEQTVAAAKAPELRHRVTMTVGPEFLATLEKVRALMSHAHPGASLEALLLECMKTQLALAEKRVQAGMSRPRPAKPTAPGSRHVPAKVRRAVWQRDQGGCTFVASDGTRCSATHRLELHHTIPYARGGPATETHIVLRCKLHNDLAARADFGDAHMNRFTRRTSLVPADPLALTQPAGP